MAAGRIVETLCKDHKQRKVPGLAARKANQDHRVRVK